MARRSKQKARIVTDSAHPDGLSNTALSYLEWMRVKNYSERTVENRELYLSYFIAWCEERGLNRPSEITKPILERYQRYLYYYRKQDGRPLSFRSQHARIVPVRAYFKYLARQNQILYNPAADLDLPRIEHRLPKHVLSVAEAEQVLAQTDVSEPLGLRDRAILELFYSTGIRRMEAIGLQLYDLDAERGTLIVRQGKGKKDRVVPIGERAAAWVEKYVLEVRGQLLVPPDDGTLFLTKDGEAFTRNRMSQLVRNYVDAAQLGKRGSCHLFRHTMATLMLEHGADIRYIQQMLGHAKLETTQIYTQVSIRQLKAIHDATHPAAKLQRHPSSESET
ncbi:MAG: recombinase XerD [Deltaproteobacteria bacterium CG2_30_63_29]|nr:MAG: recombinase XerD [Deltaproteobacteria bacterium CG2_30_63_29]PJB35217.1 MAG: recombinase XerD [Deltaproteobacteria bacterium CG_4_9_14_3_um_filter_63_12]